MIEDEEVTEEAVPIPLEEDYPKASYYHDETPVSLESRVRKLERKTTIIAIGAGLGVMLSIGMIGRMLQQMGPLMQELQYTTAEAQKLIKQQKRNPNPSPKPEVRLDDVSDVAPTNVYDPGPPEVPPSVQEEVKKIGPIDLHDEPSE